MGYKKALMAIARKLLLIVYRVLGGETVYKEPESTKGDARAKHRAIQKRVKDLQNLGFEVLPSHPGLRAEQPNSIQLFE